MSQEFDSQKNSNVQAFPDHPQLRRFVADKVTLQEITKEGLQAEGAWR